MEAFRDGFNPESLGKARVEAGSVEAVPMPGASVVGGADHQQTVAQLEAAARQAARGHGVAQDPLVHAAEGAMAPPVVHHFYGNLSPERQNVMKMEGEKIAAELAAAMHAQNVRAVLAHQGQIARWLTRAGANKAFAEQHAKIVVEELRGRTSDL